MATQKPARIIVITALWEIINLSGPAREVFVPLTHDSLMLKPRVPACVNLHTLVICYTYEDTRQYICNRRVFYGDVCNFVYFLSFYFL